jgi:type IV secretion system protein VirD4
MRRWVIPALLLVVVALPGLGGYRARMDLAHALTEQRRRVETLAAWPILREWASLRGVRAGVQAAGAATPGVAAVANDEGPSRADVPGLPDGVPSFATWRAFPVADRWTLYIRPDWAGVRLATRGGGGALAVVLGLLLLRLVGWPLVRGLWFVAMAAALVRGRRPGTSHGSARWATPAEVRALRPRPGRADLVVGEVGRWRPRPVAIPEGQLYEHTLLVAPNGTGKTAGLIVPNLLAEAGRRSLVIADAKGELAKLTGAHLRGVLGEDRVRVLDFLDPDLSAGYNPLAYVTDAASAALFAEAWVANTGTSKEAFWDNAARTLIGAAALHLVGTAPGGATPPLAALVDLLCGDPARAIRGRLAASPVPEVRRLARAFLANLEENGKLLASVFSELAPRFACLDYPQVRRVTATNELDLAGLAARPGALYVGLDLAYADLLAPLTGCLYLHLFQTLAAVARAQPSGQLPTPVLAYLDEFGTLGRIPHFPARMATIRASRFGVVLVVQALHQLAATYGKEGAATITTNATTKLCLARVSGEDADYFSRLAGTATVHSRSRGRSRATVAPLADRGNVGTGEAARPLLTPDELRTMGEGVLVVSADRHPLLARQRRYYRVPTLVRRLPDGRAPGPGDPDPLAPFRTRRAASPLPDAALVVPDPVGDAIPVAEGVAPPPVVVPPPTLDTLPRMRRVDGVDAPPPAAEAPAALSCRAAPGPAGAPPIAPGETPSAAPAAPGLGGEQAGGTPAPIRLTPTQRAVLEALVTIGRPTSAVSSTELSEETGINRSTVRAALREVRGKLGIAQGDDLLAAARARGVLAAKVTAARVARQVNDA